MNKQAEAFGGVEKALKETPIEFMEKAAKSLDDATRQADGKSAKDIEALGFAAKDETGR